MFQKAQCFPSSPLLRGRDHDDFRGEGLGPFQAEKSYSPIQARVQHYTKPRAHSLLTKQEDQLLGVSPGILQSLYTFDQHGKSLNIIIDFPKYQTTPSRSLMYAGQRVQFSYYTVCSVCLESYNFFIRLSWSPVYTPGMAIY